MKVEEVMTQAKQVFMLSVNEKLNYHVSILSNERRGFNERILFFRICNPVSFSPRCSPSSSKGGSAASRFSTKTAVTLWASSWLKTLFL